jgi:hypothetical protein
VEQVPRGRIACFDQVLDNARHSAMSRYATERKIDQVTVGMGIMEFKYLMLRSREVIAGL